MCPGWVEVGGSGCLWVYRGLSGRVRAFWDPAGPIGTHDGCAVNRIVLHGVYVPCGRVTLEGMSTDPGGCLGLRLGVPCVCLTRGLYRP